MYTYLLTISTIFIITISTFILLYRNQSLKHKRESNEIKKINELLEEIHRVNESANEIKNISLGYEDRFKVLAADSLDRNSRILKESNQVELDKIITPLKIRIEDFNNKFTASSSEAQAERASISKLIEHLTKLNLSIGEEARNLTSALKGNNRVQGKWGETVLESLLEKAGLIPGINFESQVTKTQDGKVLKNDEGKMIRPDMIIHLPNSRDIIIDAKTSLSGYLEFCEAVSPEAKRLAEKKHIVSIKRHIEELAQKNYSKSIENSLEQVIMFIPNDGALILALNSDATLIEFAATKQIMLVSPTQLSGILMIIGQIWRKENQDRNAAEIAKLGGLLYDSLESFVKDMQVIETSLSKASQAYETALSKLSTGQRSVMARAEKMKSLGIKTNKTIYH